MKVIHTETRQSFAHFLTSWVLISVLSLSIQGLTQLVINVQDLRYRWRCANRCRVDRFVHIQQQEEAGRIKYSRRIRRTAGKDGEWILHVKHGRTLVDWTIRILFPTLPEFVRDLAGHDGICYIRCKFVLKDSRQLAYYHDYLHRHAWYICIRTMEMPAL